MDPYCTAILAVSLWYGDPTISRDVAQLGSTFREREAATARLKARGWQAYHLLLTRGTTSRDAETRRRSELLLAPYYHWLAHPLPDESLKLPCIDMLDGSDRFRHIKAPMPEWEEWQNMTRDDVVRKYLAVVHAQGHTDGSPEWSDYRAAMRLLVEELQVRGWQRQRIVQLLNECFECERSWWQHAPKSQREEKP